MYIYDIFLIHSSINGYIGCFHVLAIVNSAAMNIWVMVWGIISKGFVWNTKEETTETHLGVTFKRTVLGSHTG